MGDQKPIVVVGSINTDLVVQTSRLPAAGETVAGTSLRMHQGGKGANQAVAVARLGWPVVLVGKVGSDAYGRRSLEELKRCGVDVSAVSAEQGESGVAVITVGEGGVNTIVVVAGANALVTPEYLASLRGIIAGAAMVLAQLEVPQETVLRLARICDEEGIPFMLDPAPAAQLPPGLLARCTWFTPNETEARYYGGADGPEVVAAALLAQGAQGLVVKAGERGCYLAAREGAREWVRAFPVAGVDSTAAGDVFNGAFAVGMLSGRDLLESARFASAAAAISVTREGAQASMPTREEVERLLAGQ